MLSTQRNESMNAALKKRIKHFKRTNVVRVISIISDMMDHQYHQVCCVFFKLITCLETENRAKNHQFFF